MEGPLAHVRYLADDRLEGRAVATRGERCAGDYIAARFRALGLDPVGDQGSFFQTWNVRTGSGVGPGARFALEDPRARPRDAVEVVPDEEEPASGGYALGEEWIPYGFSASATVRAALIVGSAESPSLALPDSESVAGKALVIEGAAPHPHAPPVDAHRIGSRAADLGATAVLVLLGDGDPWPSLKDERRAPLRVPVVAVRGRAAEDVRRWVSRPSSGVAFLSVGVVPVRREARNVAAVLPGSGPLGSPPLVVGAHYDHLGLGGEGSLSPDAVGVVHNGADDNASGVAVLLEVARELAGEPPLARDVLFIAFTGEERGLWGSAKYVASPLRPLEGTVAMLNLDMVGRVRDDLLTVLGVGTAEEWTGLLEGANERTASPLDLRFVSDGFGASDHSSFYARGIPVLHFFSNTHPEYHRPEDDWHRINADGMERVTDLVAALVREILSGPDVVALTPVEGARNPSRMPGPRDGTAARGGFGVRVGTIPDYSRESGGMGITGVRDGSPADRAGLRGGDVIIRFGSHEVDDVYGYMYALQGFEPGDEVEVVVLRDGKRLKFAVVLEAANRD